MKSKDGQGRSKSKERDKDRDRKREKERDIHQKAKAGLLDGTVKKQVKKLKPAKSGQELDLPLEEDDIEVVDDDVVESTHGHNKAGERERRGEKLRGQNMKAKK